MKIDNQTKSKEIKKTLIDVLKLLYKIGEGPYSAFPYSQLGLCLDQKNLFDLLRFFGGQTLYIPTVKEFTQLLQYCLVETVGGYKEAKGLVKGEIFNGFSEASYNRISGLIHQSDENRQGKKRNSKRKINSAIQKD